MILVSILATMIGSCALILVLSIFEGLRNETDKLFNKFNPDIKITAKKGKYFSFTDEIKTILIDNDNIEYFSNILEDKALIKYRDSKQIVFMKGVDSNFVNINRMDTLLSIGSFINKNSKLNSVVVGSIIANKILISINSRYTPIEVFVPKKNNNILINPQGSLNRTYTYPKGVIRVEKEFDQKYIICKINLARKIFSLKDNQISHIAIKLKKPNEDVNTITELKKLLGNNFDIKTKKEQNQLVYNILNTENMITYFIFSLILLIAMFNIIGTISIIILNKKNDIKTLWKLGVPYKRIKSIFTYISMIIVSIGGILGIIIGIIICLVQIRFEIIKIGDIPYPIILNFKNFLILLITILFFGYSSSKIAIENMFRRIKIIPKIKP